ncbi:hypothetical protein L228DRAFT_266042 [Xylona heveae TC161]|uniref:Uncharacterized protein n=1 Tax=Xylona heveae (strain CBS 132557 / TC161) TaxID=1328760 RepID=A0A165IZA5_XYLHT|nr:hypothetical protein L228DRAFT_266042 [Xylona heveae TC161]KZF25579.1 hypothetical protein L228DRAFT_266042 [Xylona heveae TC161]
MDLFRELGNPWDQQFNHSTENHMHEVNNEDMEFLMDTAYNGEPAITRAQHFSAALEALNSNSRGAGPGGAAINTGSSLTGFLDGKSYGRKDSAPWQQNVKSVDPDHEGKVQPIGDVAEIDSLKLSSASSGHSAREYPKRFLHAGHGFAEPKYFENATQYASLHHVNVSGPSSPTLSISYSDEQEHYFEQIENMLRTRRPSQLDSINQASVTSGFASSLPPYDSRSHHAEDVPEYSPEQFQSFFQNNTPSMSALTEERFDKESLRAARSCDTPRSRATGSSSNQKAIRPARSIIEQLSEADECFARTDPRFSDDGLQASLVNTNPGTPLSGSPASETFLHMIQPLRPRHHHDSVENTPAINIDKSLPPLPEAQRCYYEVHSGRFRDNDSTLLRNSNPSAPSGNFPHLSYDSSISSVPSEKLSSIIPPSSGFSPITVASVSWDPSRPMASLADPAQMIYPAVLQFQLSAPPAEQASHPATKPASYRSEEISVQRRPSRETMAAYARAVEDVHDLERISDDEKEEEEEPDPAYPKNWTSTLRKRGVPWQPVGLRMGPRPTSSVYSMYSGTSMVLGCADGAAGFKEAVSVGGAAEGHGTPNGDRTRYGSSGCGRGDNFASWFEEARRSTETCKDYQPVFPSHSPMALMPNRRNGLKSSMSKLQLKAHASVLDIKTAANNVRDNIKDKRYDDYNRICKIASPTWTPVPESSFPEMLSGKGASVHKESNALEHQQMCSENGYSKKYTQDMMDEVRFQFFI